MRLAVLAHGATGAGAISVARNLIAALARVAPHHAYGVTFPSGLGYEEISLKIRNVQTFRWPGGGLLRRWYWERGPLLGFVRHFQPDVLLCLADRGLVDPPCPQAVLMHRTQMFYPPKHYANETWLNKLLFRYHARNLRRAIRPSDMILCQTEAARTRIAQRYDQPCEIVLCPNAVSSFAILGDDALGVPEVLRPHAPRTKLFCLSRYYPHKNLECLLSLFTRHRSALDGVVVFLTLAAEQHRGAARLLDAIEREGLQDSIVNVGPVSQTQLAGYYRHCDALFMPTLLESFSSTYIEAMHFGTPILTSDLDFAHDVCGDAALYFDPWDIDSIARTITQFRDQHWRWPEMARLGTERLARRFRAWDEIAVNLEAALERLAARQSRR